MECQSSYLLQIPKIKILTNLINSNIYPNVSSTFLHLIRQMFVYTDLLTSAQNKIFSLPFIINTYSFIYQSQNHYALEKVGYCGFQNGRSKIESKVLTITFFRKKQLQLLSLNPKNQQVIGSLSLLNLFLSCCCDQDLQEKQYCSQKQRMGIVFNHIFYMLSLQQDHIIISIQSITINVSIYMFRTIKSVLPKMFLGAQKQLLYI